MQAFAKLLGQSSGSITKDAAASAAATSSESNASAIPIPAQSAKFSPAAMSSATNPQPKVETIAHLPTLLPASSTGQPTLPGALLDFTSAYIVYSVKNGHVRVLDRADGSKTLLRGHNVKVVDVAFFNANSSSSDGGASASTGADVLATVGGSGDKSCVIIWRLFRGPEELNSEKLLEVRFQPARRIVWHPFDPNKFMLLHDGDRSSNSRVVATLVETTRLVTVPHAAGGHAVCLCGGGEPNAQSANDDGVGGSDIEGAVKLIVPASPASAGGEDLSKLAANDIVFSPTSARHVLTAHNDGTVRLWDSGTRCYVDMSNGLVQSDAFATDGAKEVSAAMMSWVKVSEGAVNSCRFLTGYVDARPPAGASSSTVDDLATYVTPPFLTGSENNTKITLWSPFTTTGSPPVPVYTFQLELGDRSLPMVLGLGSTSSGNTHLFVADSENGRMFVLHSSYCQGGAGKVATGFDYLAPFDTVHPIFSMKCTIATSGGDNTDNDDTAGGLSLYCVQGKAIQVLTCTSKMLAGPPAGAATVGVEVLREDQITPGALTDDEMDQDAAAEALVAELEEDDEGEEGDFEDYEDYDDDGGDDGDEGEEDDDSTPAASSLPSPGLPNQGGADPFANWLGHLAAGSTGGAPPPARSASSPLPPVTTPPPGITPAQSQNDIASPPPPPAGAVPPTPAPTPQVVPKPAPPAGLIQQALLNPMELLSPSSLEEDADNAPAVESKTNEKKASAGAKKQPQQQTEKKTKTNQKNKKGKASNSGSGGSAAAGASAPGKIAILKRDETPVASNSSGQGIAVAASTAPITTHASLVEDVRVAVRTELLSAGLAGPNKKEQQSTEALAEQVSKSVAKSLEKSLADPIKKSVEKLNAADKKRQDSTMDAAQVEKMSGAISEGVKGPVVQAFHGAMKDVMIPAYEAATRQIFSQIASAISEGMAQQAEAQAKAQTEALSKIQAQVQAQASTGPDQATLRTMQAMASQMENMARTIDGLRGEVARLNGAVQARGGSIGGPPGMAPPPMQAPPQIDPAQVLREEIVVLLKRRDYEAAFTKALSASNGEVAVFACKNANIQDVLEGNAGPNLSQPILLCLMQQLGATLAASSGSDLRTELSWIQDIAVTLDPNDTTIHKHVGGVLNQLVSNLNAKMAEGDPSLQRPLRMLLQVIRGIGGA